MGIQIGRARPTYQRDCTIAKKQPGCRRDRLKAKRDAEKAAREAHTTSTAR